MQMFDFCFKSVNRLAGFNGSRAGKAAYAAAKCLLRVPQMWISSVKRFFVHGLIIAEIVNRQIIEAACQQAIIKVRG